MRSAVVDKITERAAKDKKVFFIAGDAGYGVLDEFQNRFADRFLNLGVAEQNAISFSAGLALAGFKVFVYNIIPFVMYRCYEQVRNDICYQRLAVTLIGIGSGLTYAPQGMTHYSVEDINLAASLPNLTVLSPCDPMEAQKCAEYALDSKGPVYIRIAKAGEPLIHKNELKDLNPKIVRSGSKAAVLFHGSIGIEVLEAVKSLKEEIMLVSIPMLQPLNFSFLLSRLKGIHTLITVEEHFSRGGLGSIIADWIVEKKLPFRLMKLGIKNEFIHAVKNNAAMRSNYGISFLSIKKAIKKALNNG